MASNRQSRTERVVVYLSPAQARAWREFARMDERSLSAAIRFHFGRYATQRLRRASEGDAGPDALTADPS